jgi:subtilisin family serine protease
MFKIYFPQTIKKTLLFLFLVFLINSMAYAQKTYDVIFQDTTIEISENINSFEWRQMSNFTKYKNGYFGWVQFYKTPNQQTQDYFKINKLQLLEYISNGTYLFYFPENTSISLLKAKGVRAIIPLIGEYKMSKGLKNGTYKSWAEEGNRILVTLQFYENVNLNDVIKKLMNLKIRVKQQYKNSNTIELSVPKNNLVELSNLPYVKWIELIAAPSVPEDTRGRNLHRSSSLDTRTGMGRNYTGAGIGVMVRDDGIVGPHIDFQGRIDNSATSDMIGIHGDGVAGIMAGAGNLDPSMRGMAAGSNIYVVNYGPSFLDAATQTLINNGNVQITNSSFGNGQNDGYTTTAQTVDQQTHTIPSLLHVFSTGNSGTGDFGYDAGTGWGNITGGHKQGKNVIATANVFFDGSLVSSSSRGPASDGRIKPDIAANGENQNSTDTNNQYMSFGGTSGAAPGIAGVSAQLYEAYGNLNAGALPESALIKATLLNTANEAGHAGPDYKFGWGIVNGLRAGKLIEAGRYLKSTVSQSNANSHIINIPAGTKQVRFMAYWSDVAAAAGATTALINDLDLVVTDPANGSHLPWILDPTPNAATLDLPATNGIDRLNNMEQVLLNNPAAGNYNINITGYNIPMGPQEYYIVYEIITEELTLTYPNGGESFAPGETESIHWDATNTTSDFVLEYSIDAGSSWISMTTVGSTVTNYTWIVPASVTGNAAIRITSGSFSDTSDARFSIARLTSNVQVVQVCPNTASFSWTPVPGAESYDIYLLGSTSMDLVGSSTLSSITVPITDYLSPIWAAVVVKNDTQGWKSRRTIAINHSGGLLNCSLVNDLAVLSIQNTDEDFSEIGCLGAPNNIISVTLQNLGTDPQSNFIISYQLDSNTTVQETYSGTLVNGQQVLYNFTTPLIIPSNGNYTLTISVVITGDQNPINNSAQFNFEADIDGVPELICKNTTVWLDGAGNASITRQDVTDNLEFAGYTQQGTTYDPVFITGTAVYLDDDIGTIALPIGFDFNFLVQIILNFISHQMGLFPLLGTERLVLIRTDLPLYLMQMHLTV